MPAARARRTAPLAPALVVTVSLIAGACGSDDPGADGGSQLSGGASGAASGAKNDPACPREQPRMGEPCSGDLECPSYYSESCATYDYAACKNGHWYTKRGLSGKCNPPAPCPEEEPDPAAAECPKYAFGGSGALCRYARATCFVYLACAGNAPHPWKEDGYATRAADSCCPATPAIVGSACSEEAILCEWANPSLELECRKGQWAFRVGSPGLGEGGAAGAAGASGGASGSGS